MCGTLLISLSVWHQGSWGKTSRSHKSLGTQAWPESWTPTHGDTFVLMKMIVWAICIPSTISSPSAQTLLWGQLLSSCLLYLWADPNTEKSWMHESSSSAWTFWRVCGKMVLVFSKSAYGSTGASPRSFVSKGNPGYLLQILDLVKEGLERPIGTDTKLKKKHKHQDVLE